MPDRTTQTGMDWMQGHLSRSFASTIGRAQTTSTVLFYLPPGPTILRWQVVGTTSSNAGTSATLAIGSDGGGGSDFLAGFDLKSHGNEVAFPSSAAVGFVNNPNPIAVTAKVTEAGSGSSSGGPWTVIVDII